MRIAQGPNWKMSEQNTRLLLEFESLIEKSLTTTELRPLIERLRKCYKCSWVGRRYAQRAFEVSRSKASRAVRAAEIERIEKVFEAVYAGLTQEQRTTAEMKEIKEAILLSLQDLNAKLK